MKEALGTAQVQNGDLRIATEANEISQNTDLELTISQKPNGDLHHAIGVNGGPESELEADKRVTTRADEDNQPYQPAITSTGSVTDPNLMVHANSLPHAIPLADAKAEIDAHPVANATPVADSGPVAEAKHTAGSTPATGKYPTLVDTSTMASLKPTAGEVSKAYIAEDGMTNRVPEALTASKVN